MGYHHKTLYYTPNHAIQTSLPSPSDSSPSLTQSMSNSSNSPNSPPLPCTPPPRPSRSSTRYPDLGRVPLHRRGTSQTYERLEDLLKEAGYKETRVFTPEGEHEDGTYHEDDLPSARRSMGGVREGVDAVVGFLTGLLPSSTAQSVRSVATTRPGSSERADEATESPTSQTYTPALSPTLSAKTQKQLHALSHSTPRSSTDDIPALRRLHSPTCATPIPHSPPSPYYSHRYPQHLQHHAVQRISGYSGPSQRGAINAPPSRQPSLRAIKETLPNQQTPQPIMTLAHPRPSRATAYLRRMASRSEVPERPNSTPVRPQPRVYLNDHDVEIGEGKTNDEHEADHQPPLPRSWLETVARAVLFGGGGLHIGGPLSQRDQETFPSPPSSATISPKQEPRMLTKAKIQTLRHTRSSISHTSQPNPKRARSMKPHALRAALTEQTNKSQSKVSVRSVSSGVSVDMLSPPELFLRVGRGRATHCEGQVSHMRVYCRSAPSSRSASAARGGGKKGILKHGRCNGSKKAERDRVPSLAKTKAEGDMWARPKKRKAGMDGVADRSLWGWDMAMDGGGGRYSRHRQQASIRLGDRMDGGYGSEAAVGRGYPDDGCGLSSDEEDEVSDDDDGELDLARILVPPKRQHSIISLRKHLAVPIRVSSRASSKARAAASASRLGEGVGVGEFEREIEGGGGASAALSKVVGSSTIPAIRIRGGYEPGYGYLPPILGPVGAKH